MVSNTSEIFTSLFNLFGVLGIIVGGVVLGLLAYFTIKYRERGNPVGEPEDAPKLGVIPGHRANRRTVYISLVLSTGILSLLVFGTFGAVDVLDKAPEGTLDINVIAFQWGWRFKYPNGREVVGELRVPQGEVVRVHVTSTDVFHNFGMIDFRIKADAIPGRTNQRWFVATEPGVYDALCFELCGVGHAFMRAKIIVMEKGEFQSWYSSLR